MSPDSLPGVHILSIEIKNYRCFEDFRLDIDGKSLLLIAPNAGGKTSLLTATHMALQGGREVRLGDFSDPSLPIEIVVTLGGIPPTAHAAFAQAMTFGQPPQLRVGIRATWDAHEGELEVLHGFPDDGWRRAGRDARTNLPVFWLSASREVSRLLAFAGPRSLLDALVRTLDLEEPLDSAVAYMSAVARQLSDAPALQAMLASLRDELAMLVPGVAADAYELGVDATEPRDLLRQFEVLLEHEGPPSPIFSHAGGLGQLTVAAVTLRLVALEPGAVLLVDEPEQSLHPQAQRALVTTLRAAAGQSMIATHSANVLNRIDPRRITRLRRNAVGDIEAVSTAPLTDTEARRVTRYATAQTTEAYFAHTVVVVEGPSDLLALREFAECSGILLDAKGIAVLSLEGADVFGTYLTLLGPGGLDLQIRGVCDADRETRWRTELNRVGVPVTDRASLNAAGVHVCDPDLEAELLGALTIAEVEQVFIEDGGLQEFQTFAQQPANSQRSLDEQQLQFVKKGKVRWAPLLAAAIDVQHIPAPMVQVLAGI